MAGTTPRRPNPPIPEVYRGLPTNILQTCTGELGIQVLGTSGAEKYVSGFLSFRGRATGLVEQMKVQMMWLEGPARRRGNRARKTRSHTQKRLSSREKKELKLYEIPKDKQRYSLYLPLHELWKSYMHDLLQVGAQKGCAGQSQMNHKVIKADLHGCLLKVERSKCPSYVGMEGIVLQETQNTFKLITPSDRLKTVPKANSVFTFDLGGYCFSLYGNHLRFRAGERSARKFKDKPTLDL